MADYAHGIADRYLHAAAEFEARLRGVRPEQWQLPTPCTEWDVRRLVNHMTRGNLNHAALANGGTGAGFLRLRDADALGTDPVGAYARSVEKCAEAYARPGALERILDHPLGRVPGAQALAVRTVDSIVHAWDLARAVGACETLDAALVAWAEDSLDEIHAGLGVSPADRDSGPAGRFFAAAEDAPASTAVSRQDRLLRWTGRKP